MGQKHILSSFMFYFLRLFRVDLTFFLLNRPRATFRPANFPTGFLLAPSDFGVTLVDFLAPADFGVTLVVFFLFFLLPLPADVGVTVSF